MLESRGLNSMSSEDERLDTMFQLNVKGITQFGSGLVVIGTITAAADGTASKHYLYNHV